MFQNMIKVPKAFEDALVAMAESEERVNNNNAAETAMEVPTVRNDPEKRTAPDVDGPHGSGSRHDVER